MTIEEEGIEDGLEKLRAMEQRMANMSPILRVIGADLVELIDSNFDKSTAPDGTLWAPLKAPRRHQRDTGPPKPLIDTGRLRRSITYQAGRRHVDVGTNVVYAGTHQWGTVHVPARPFVPIDIEGNWTGSLVELEFIKRTVTRWIETGSLSGAF